MDVVLVIAAKTYTLTLNLTLTLIYQMLREQRTIRRILTFSVMHVVLVLVGPSSVHLPPFDDLDGVKLPVPPTAHDSGTHLQRQYTRFPLPAHVILQRVSCRIGRRQEVSVAGATESRGRAVLRARRVYRAHFRLIGFSEENRTSTTVQVSVFKNKLRSPPSTMEKIQ